MICELVYKDKDEWLSLRKGYIGGSDAGAVLGFNPYKSAYSLWAEKTGKIPEFEGNIITRVGSYLEELVAQMFAEETGKKVRKKNRMLVNTDYPFACADVDRMVVGEKAILEIKTTNSIPVVKKFKNGEYPETWYCQMTHYLAVSGLEKAYLAVLIECREFRIFELQRDEEEIAALMNAEREFWKLVQNNTPPRPDGAESTTKAIQAIYPSSDGETVDISGRDIDLARYMQLSAQIKELEMQKDEVANRVKSFLGNAGRGESEIYKVTWTSSERKTFDSNAFSKDNPNINLNQYYKISSSRAFRVTEKKV